MRVSLPMQRVLMNALCVWSVSLLFFMALVGNAQQKSKGEKPDAVQAEFFEAKVRPILVASCAKCHGASNTSGGLRLDTREGLLKGGAHGPVVMPHKPSESLLLQAISYSNPRLKM